MNTEIREIRLTTPIPPSVNHMYAAGSGGRRFKTDTYRAFEDTVRLKANSVVDEPLCGRLALTLRVYGLRANADLDNVIKALQDSLEGVVYVNDKQICELHAYRCAEKREACVEVEVCEVES